MLRNVEIRIEGNLTYPDSIPQVQAAVQAAGGSLGWMTFTGGNNVTLRGSTDPHWGWINGKGQAWWDKKVLKNRPSGVEFTNINNGVIRDMKICEPVAWNFGTSGSNGLHIFNNRIYAISSNPEAAFPTNTDGFSARGSNLLFENNHVVNGDDCLTVGSGANNIHFRDSYCEGGHGLSIGSLGKSGSAAIVSNILIENVTMKNSDYGARFKSWNGGHGSATNVTWKNIILDNVRLPIYVTQNYWDSNMGPNPHNASPSNNVHLQDFLFKNFSGTIADSPVVPGSNGTEAIIFDIYPNTASNIVANGISVANKNGAPVIVKCDPAAISNVGFKCQNGPFVHTAVGLKRALRRHARAARLSS